MTTQPLKLLAKDVEDVQVMSAVLQDAIVPACDMTFHKKEASFVMEVQRFKWDGMNPRLPRAANDVDVYERISCAVEVQGVQQVQFSGMNPNDPAAMFELLALRLEGDHLYFIFAGEGQMRLTLADWSMKLADFGEAWPTTHCPSHERV
jgi:hypothetical protein